MCGASLDCVENEVLYTLKILGIHLGLVNHKSESIRIQVVVSSVAIDFLEKMIFSRKAWAVCSLW